MSTTMPPMSAFPKQAHMQAGMRLIDQAKRAGIESVAKKVLAQERLDLDDGLALYAADLFAVGALANHVRERLHGDATYFNVNQHVNYTNLCNRLCKFCAFQRLPGQDGAYIMSPEDAAQKITEQLAEPVTEVHVVGGVWPKLNYDYYLNLLRAIKAARPALHIKGFTMVELDEIARQAKKPLPLVLEDLKTAGLGSCPGGGAEIFNEEVRLATYPMKMPGSRWLEVAACVHAAGLYSNCTMLHGHIETPTHRVDHLDKLRRLQDTSLEHGKGSLQAYIPLSFHPDHSQMADVEAPTALDELREIAIARLMLDNIPHIKAYWILMDIPTAQTALSFGANDVDGTVIEEKIYHEAGAATPQKVQRTQLVRWIEDAGRVPIERNTLYDPIGDSRGLF